MQNHSTIILMSDQTNYPQQPVAPGSSENTKKLITRHYGISRLIEKIRSLQALHICAGLCQLFLGLAVVIVSILGLIRPLWLSMILSVMACVTAMTGIYFSYSAIAERDKKTLLRDAMRRIADAQN